MSEDREKTGDSGKDIATPTKRVDVKEDGEIDSAIESANDVVNDKAEKTNDHEAIWHDNQEMMNNA